MKIVDFAYGAMFFGASIVYVLVLNHFVTLFGQFYNFFYLFGLCVCILLATISLTNSYIKNLNPRFQEYVSIIYAIAGFVGLKYTNNYIFTSICSVLAIYYLVRFIKLDLKRIKLTS